VTQLRPVLDIRLLALDDCPDEETGWEMIRQDFLAFAPFAGKYRDLEFLRVLRVLWELSKTFGSVHGRLYFDAA